VNKIIAVITSSLLVACGCGPNRDIAELATDLEAFSIKGHGIDGHAFSAVIPDQARELKVRVEQVTANLEPKSRDKILLTAFSDYLRGYLSNIEREQFRLPSDIELGTDTKEKETKIILISNEAYSKAGELARLLRNR